MISCCAVVFSGQETYLQLNGFKIMLQLLSSLFSYDNLEIKFSQVKSCDPVNV